MLFELEKPGMPGRRNSLFKGKDDQNAQGGVGRTMVWICGLCVHPGSHAQKGSMLHLI